MRSDADVDGRPDPIRAWRSEVYTGPNAREESVATPHDRGSIASERASACARAKDRLGTHEEMSSEGSIRYAWFIKHLRESEMLGENYDVKPRGRWSSVCRVTSGIFNGH